MATELRVGLVGYAFMGRAHSHGWRNVARIFDLPVSPRMTALCGRDERQVSRAATMMGWERAETDWRSLVESKDIDLIDICTPGSSHEPIALAALAAGKHVICEKPLANSVPEAERMAAAAESASAGGLRSMVGFNYRCVPAVELARRLIAEGRIGEVRHVRASYLQDWAVDPELPLLWRFDGDLAGTGALGDLASHIIDLAQHLVGDLVARLNAIAETFIPERPLLDGLGRGLVTVDDAAAFIARFSSGATATFEVSRLAPGRKNALRIEINGTDGSLAWSLERLNELELYLSADDAEVRASRTVLVTEAEHPWISAWWPPGHIVGWEHTFTHEFKHFLEALASGEAPAPSFSDGLQVQRVLEAVVRSAGTGKWEITTP